VSTYLEVKLRFREVTGRYDLIAADGTDTGGGHYINMGLKWLEQHVDRVVMEVEVGAVIDPGYINRLEFPLSIVRSVAMLRSADIVEPTYTELERITIQEMMALQAVTSVVGTPLYWSISPAYPATLDISYITINPAPDVTYDFVARGKTTIPPLEVDGTTNYWTLFHDELLVWTSCYCLEVAYRNSEGAKDWFNSIEQYVYDLQKEKVDGEMLDSMILEG
jgi:hypothetical protein